MKYTYIVFVLAGKKTSGVYGLNNRKPYWIFSVIETTVPLESGQRLPTSHVSGMSALVKMVTPSIADSSATHQCSYDGFALCVPAGVDKGAHRPVREAANVGEVQMLRGCGFQPVPARSTGSTNIAHLLMSTFGIWAGNLGECIGAPRPQLAAA